MSFRYRAAVVLAAAVVALPGCIIKGTRRGQVPRYDAETFYRTTTLFGASFSPDESRLLVTSDVDGVFNVYSYPVDGGDPVQLTRSTGSPNMAVAYMPNDERFLFSADQGGNELNHVYVVELDGTVVDLTPAEGCRASFRGFSRDDARILVATNQRDKRFMDLYSIAIPEPVESGRSGAYELEPVFENPGGLGLGPMSDDGRWLAVIRSHNNSDNDIYLVDLQKPGSEPVLATEHEGFISHSPQGFSRDSSTLFFSSNEGSEFARIVAHRIESGEQKIVHEADWDVSSYRFSWSGDHLIITVNEDARSRVTVIDTRSGREVSLAGLPDGLVRGLSVARSGESLACYINRDTSPSNLYVLDLGSGKARALTQSLNPAIDERHLVESEVVRFKSFDGLEIPAILYRPRQASRGTPAPAMLYVHGGPGGQTRVGYNPTIQHLVNHGYAILGINNRGSSGYGKTFFHLDDRRHGQDDLADCVHGRKYLESLAWVDRSRIGIMGGSYGGYMVAAALAFEPEVFDVGINIFGVTNWLRTLTSIPPWWEAQKLSLYAEMGDPATDAERLRAISPLFHAERIQRPLLVVQGANDPRVLQVESDELVAAAKKNGVPVEYLLFDDEGHGFRKRENRIAASEAYLSFLNKHLN